MEKYSTNELPVLFIKYVSRGRFICDQFEAAGITVGAKFEVYQDQNSGHLLGTVVARKLSPFSITLYAKESRFALDGDGVALNSRAGTEEQVRVYVADESLKDRAEFGMALKKERVVFNIYDSDVTRYGLIRMPYIEAISPVIHAAAHFYWHRRRTLKNGRGLAGKVKIEVTAAGEC